MIDPPVLDRTTKWLLLLGGVAVPIVSHLGIAAWVDATDPRPWTDPLGLQPLESWRGWKLVASLTGVYPLIAFAMVCYAWLVNDWSQRCRARWVRFGLFTGLPMAVASHGFELSQLGLGRNGLVLFHLFAAILAVAIWATWNLLSRYRVGRVYSAIASCLLWIGMLSLLASAYVIANGDTTSAAWVAFPLMTAIIAVVLFGPLIWLGCLMWLVLRLMERCPAGRQFSIGGLMAWMTWLGIFFAACRYAITAA